MTEYRLTTQPMSISGFNYCMVELQDKKGKVYAVNLQEKRLANPYMVLATIARLHDFAETGA